MRQIKLLSDYVQVGLEGIEASWAGGKDGREVRPVYHIKNCYFVMISACYHTVFIYDKLFSVTYMHRSLIGCWLMFQVCCHQQECFIL